MIGYPTHTECLTVITTKVLKLIAPLYQRPLVHLDHRIQKGREIGDGKDVLKTLICHTYMSPCDIQVRLVLYSDSPQNICEFIKTSDTWCVRYMLLASQAFLRPQDKSPFY